MDDMFTRTRALIGDAALEILRGSRVAVFGVGGVGGHCVEALVRSGVGHLLLVDGDEVVESNLNRQAVAYRSTLGCPKAEAMRERMLDINPDADITALRAFYLPGDEHGIWDRPLDLVVDAIDTVAAKADLALQAQKRGVKIVSCMGAGNKRNPFLFEAADISETSVCPLCRAMRKACRDRGVERLRVIYSKEPRASRGVEGDGRNGRPAPASLMPVTATAGLLLASEAIRLLTEQAQ